MSYINIFMYVSHNSQMCIEHYLLISLGTGNELVGEKVLAHMLPS